MPPPRPQKRARDEAGLPEAPSRPSKRTVRLLTATPHSEHHDRHISDGNLIMSFYEPPLFTSPTSPIENLPQELLLQVFEHLVHPSLVTAGFPEQPAIYRRPGVLRDYEEDSHGFVRAVDREDLCNARLVSRKFAMAATTLLYRCAHFATAQSPINFLLTLRSHPALQPLVKHISVPTYVGRITKRFNFALSHPTEGWTASSEHLTVWRQIQSYADCGTYFNGGVLGLMLPLVPNLRTLIIPQAHLLDGPFTEDLVLENLTTMRINLMVQNEAMVREYGFSCAPRTVAWLNPDFIGYRFPALQRLEISSPNALWEANLVPGDVDTTEGAWPRKYVESLKTTTTFRTVPAIWDLMTLQRPIFHSSKIRTLDFGGPGTKYDPAYNVAPNANWDLNHFLTERGSGLHTLSLDWEVHDDDEADDLSPEEVYFGPAARLATLHNLTNLTRLTVSLQVLFGHAQTFWDWMEDMESSPDAEVASLLPPPSLRVLRISEYIPGVYEYAMANSSDADERDEQRALIREHSGNVFRFLQALRARWLQGAEGRELWFRRYHSYELFVLGSRASLGRDTFDSILDDSAGVKGGFKRVLRRPGDMVWGPLGDDDDGDGGDGESEDKKAASCENQDGEQVGVYQDGTLVLV